LIYCAITGYGQDGPYRDLVGHDLNYIATAGVLSILGRAGQLPTIPHNLIADYAGGGMHAAIGILAALVARTQSGRGQFVDISMMDGSMALMAQSFASFFANGRLPARGETPLDGAIPNYNLYETKDGKIITIGAIEPWFFANLCRALGREDLVEHEYNSARRAEIQESFRAIFRTKTRDEWFEILSRTDVCVGKMNTLDEVEADPQVQARKMIVELDTPEGGRKVKQVGISVKLSETPGSIRSLAPTLGQHTEEVMHGLGYSDEQIEKWRADGSVK
jgi:crotonobetainyl-CoA:carnitine CoA-transferase CaiB-like acyl-CoA transferase